MQISIAGKSFEEWKKKYPILEQILNLQEVFWTNPQYLSCNSIAKTALNEKDIEEAEQRLIRFAPYIKKVFPATRELNGIIESPLVSISKMQESLQNLYGKKISGSLYLKCDNQLPISGSVKARGGIYEVLKVAEDIALEQQMLQITDDYSILEGEKFKKLFSKYSIVVGSTGNLGLSIGIIGAALGFKVIVHMSADARQWKKDMLRTKGVTVVEHNSDYGLAVKAGREQAQKDSHSYFIDDEKSRNLFIGYAVAGKRLKKQLDQMNVPVDQNHPLFVYIPCGVGGGPGGITFGLKNVFKENVHCFFAEPTHSPAMLLGLMTRLHNKVSVQDFGIDNITEADGLAVGRPSGFVGKALENDISGVFTVQDAHLYSLLKTLADSQDISLEPSALAGFVGPIKLFSEPLGRRYLEEHNLMDKIQNVNHLVWATGGSMVPKAVMDGFYNKAILLNKERRD